MSCPEGQYFCNDKQKCMPIPKGHKVRKDGELVKEAVKGQDTETRKEMSAERKAGDKKKSVKAGESYATFQKQRIKWADQTSKSKKHMHGSIDEVAPPGWGHTKAEKEKTKPNKPKSKIGGSAAAFDRARKEGRFKGSKADMFKLMWWMKNKGGKPKGKPHYKPGTDKKYKKYQEEGLTPMQDNNLFGNAYAGSYEDLKKKIGSKKKHNKPAIKESSFRDYMDQAQAARDRLKKKQEDRKKHDAQYMDTKSKGVRFFDKKGKGRIKSGKKIYD